MANDKIPASFEKVVIEYPLSSNSVQMIWDSISSAPALSAWFADEVTVSGKTYSFRWGKNEIRHADLTNCRQGTYVRFHWQDEDPGTYFEMRILYNEMSGNYTLEVTDFAPIGETDDVRDLWDNSIEALRRCGL